MAPHPIRSLALISSHAGSLSNFRGPLMAALIARGVKVWALAPDFDEEARARVVATGAIPIDIALDRVGMHPARDAKDLLALASRLRQLRPDATLGYFIKPVIYGTLAARLAGVPRRFGLIAGMGYVFTEGQDAGNIKRRLLRTTVGWMYAAALASCERVLLHNRDDMAELIAKRWLDPAKAVLIAGTGIRLDQFVSSAPTIAPLRFTLVARLLREKGVIEFVEAARTIQADHPEVRFDLVGGADPNPGGIPEATVRGWVAEGVIDWHGHVEDTRPYYTACSVFVLPSYREGKPRSTQEAMASGRAVITTDAPGCRDTVEEGVNGFKVPVRNSAALAAAMRRFVLDPALATRMGRAGRLMAESTYDVDIINETIITTLDAPSTSL